MISSPLAVLFVLATVVLTAVWLEARYRTFRSLGAALVSILLAMLLSNLGLIPGTSPAYDFLAGPAVSAGIVLILLAVDLRTVVQAGPRMLGAFAVGAVGTAAGAVTAALLLAGAIGPETWKLAGQYTATYTGGGANFAAVGAALETSGELFAAGIAADVIVTAIWMATCLAVPVLWGRGRGGAVPGLEEQTQEPVGSADALDRRLYATVGTVALKDIGGLMVVVLGTLWVAELLAARTPLPGVLWLTTIALLLAQVPHVKALRGAAVFGNYLVLWFLASNGASSVIANIVAVGPPIFYFALVTVGIHGLVIFVGGRLVGLDLKTLAVASQANVGGPASAMALASARGYTDRLLPGVAVGLLGYAVGNYIGFAVASVMRGVIGG
ncbi:MAG: DUF819 family protein [Gemmatimonadota bacterium]|nr:DUF819 family protein [Gemmatimonadota bacterium]